MTSPKYLGRLLFVTAILVANQAIRVHGGSELEGRCSRCDLCSVDGTSVGACCPDVTTGGNTQCFPGTERDCAVSTQRC